jgi:S1-C subfamily serine protease
MTFDETWDDERRFRLPSATGFAAFAAVAALVVCAFVLQHTAAALDHERGMRDAALRKVRERLAALEARNASLSGRVGSTEQALRRRDGGTAALARRVLRSVFTVETNRGLGTGFVAWRDADGTYILTANHVVDGQLVGNVSLSRAGGSWTGEVISQDEQNDLAVVRLDAHPAGAEPLWQKPSRRRPRVGDQLVLVGSPFGLAGTVTTGVVSRVTKKLVQTDAAANPGNSGGPAVDRQGHIVGVLVAGGGENINFAIRIDRACVKLRACH